MKDGVRIWLATAVSGCLLFSIATADSPARSPETSPADTVDVILRGGTIHRGLGGEGQPGDVAISGDRVVAIGDLGKLSGHVDLDVSGLVVAPGFINMLSWGVTSLLVDGRALSDVSQGVTLEVFGEGWSMGPLPGPEHLEDFRRQVDAGDVPFDWQTLGEYLEALESRGVSPNIASFVGATTVRIHELGFDDRAPTPGELARMQKLVREAMEEGALGLSSSLIYPPAFFASTQELIALASAAGEYDGMYISHLRSETGGLMAAIEELVTIARQAGVSAEIYHLKLAGRRNWSNFDEVVGVIEAARRDGIRISANMYTYTAGVSGLAATVPPWVQAGGTDAFMERLSDSSLRRRVITQMSESSSDWENFFHASGPDGIVIAGGDANVVGELRGQSIGEIARQRDMDPRQLVVDLLLESRNSVRAVYFLMSEANVARQIALPWVSFGSDGDARAVDTYPGIPSSHPRVYGNVARLLGRYVREKGVISLAEAIRRLTSLPAENLGLRERGRLEPGYFADIVVFDPLTIRDLSTYEYPDQLSAGIEHVFVNGEHVIRDRKHTGALPGRVVRGPGWKPGQTKDGER